MDIKRKKDLEYSDLPPSNIEDYMYFEGLLEKEFTFFKEYYEIYSKIKVGHLKINKEIYEDLFGCDKYWDKLYSFKECFDSKYHYFSSQLYDLVPDFK